MATSERPHLTQCRAAELEFPCSRLLSSPGVNSCLNVNRTAALSKGTFLVPETGNPARHLHICFQMNWLLRCKYLTSHHGIPTKVSTRFSASSISHRQKGPLLFQNPLWANIDSSPGSLVWEGTNTGRGTGSGRRIVPLGAARRPWRTVCQRRIVDVRVNLTGGPEYCHRFLSHLC